MKDYRSHSSGIPTISSNAQTYTLTASTALDIVVPTGAKFVKFRSAVPLTDVFYLRDQATALLPTALGVAAGYQEVRFHPGIVGATATGLGTSTAGTQAVSFGHNLLSTHATGLANDATVYTAAVVVDGGASQPVAVTGSAVQTFAALITAIEVDVVDATLTLVDNLLVFTSDTTGTSSTVAITDTDLFLSIVPPFDAVESAVAGTNPTYTAATVIDGGASEPISIAGDDAQTFTTLLTELDADSTGVASIAGGNLLITSPTTGIASTVAITDTDLFTSLTNYRDLQAAVAGLATGSQRPGGPMLSPDVVALEGETTISLISAGTPTINVQFYG